MDIAAAKNKSQQENKSYTKTDYDSDGFKHPISCNLNTSCSMLLLLFVNLIFLSLLRILTFLVIITRLGASTLFYFITLLLIQ